MGRERDTQTSAGDSSFGTAGVVIFEGHEINKRGFMRTVAAVPSFLLPSFSLFPRLLFLALAFFLN